MKNKIILVLVVGFALALHAATLNLTIVLTPREAKGLTLATAIFNQGRTNQEPPLPALTQAEYAEKCLRDTLSVFADRATERDRRSLAERYEAATQAKRDQVDAIIP